MVRNSKFLSVFVALALTGMVLAQGFAASAPAAAQSTQDALDLYYALGNAQKRQSAHECLYAEDLEGLHKCMRSAVSGDGGSWEAWHVYGRKLAQFDQPGAAARAFRKAFELGQRCADGTTVHCARIMLPQENATAFSGPADVYMHIGDYAGAAAAYRSALDLVYDGYDENYVEWLAVARFASSDAQSAWDEYKGLFRGSPFPSFNEENLSERDARSLQTPPDGFYDMLWSRLNYYRYLAYRKGHLFYEYFHAQNMARAEALKNRGNRGKNYPRPYESRETRDNLIALYLTIGGRYAGERVASPENSIFRHQPPYKIRPALSSYALEAAERAHEFVRKRKYQEAENMLRLALATDPWWLEAQYKLAELEFINYGHCGPDETLDFIEELLAQGIYEASGGSGPSMMQRSVDGFQAKLDDIFREAKESGSLQLEAWCDIEGAVAIRPDIEVR